MFTLIVDVEKELFFNAPNKNDDINVHDYIESQQDKIHWKGLEWQ